MPDSSFSPAAPELLDLLAAHQRLLEDASGGVATVAFLQGLCREVFTLAPNAAVAVVRRDPAGGLLATMAGGLPPGYADRLRGCQPACLNDLHGDPDIAPITAWLAEQGWTLAVERALRGDDGELLGFFCAYARGGDPKALLPVPVIDLAVQHARLALERDALQARVCQLGLVDAQATDRNADRRALQVALGRALSTQGELLLRYQPQLRLADGELYGVEALARWQHPRLGEILPDNFVPLAEACGLIDQIGTWAVREACQQLARWRAAGAKVPSVSVNLSPTQFRNPDLAEQVAAVLSACGLAPSDLTLELTESVYMDPDAESARMIHAVHALGVRLSVDDFGTGYSSLARLRDLPVDELKLDRGFIQGLDHDRMVRALTRAVVGIGASLNLAVVVEGVETEAQRKFLSECGAQAAQGFLYAEPLGAEDLPRWLRQRRGAGVVF